MGSWIVDPRGGRAPVGESIALIADSKWLVPLSIGLGSLAAAAVAWIFRKRVRPGAGFLSPSEVPIQQEA
jgi:hypothetical protein